MKADTRQWAPPSGVAAEMLPAGVHWDAVSSPSYLGDRVLARLGRESGAVIRDPYGHRLIWLVPPRTTEGWVVPETSWVQPLSVTQYLTVPPVWCTRSASPHWIRGWADHGLTDARLLYVVLDAVIRAEHGPREHEGGAGR
ncbi:hypothetical protein [Streptomyces daliensis]|uniref:Uncharacterized protein n=1 Tax=Streptomyces daliensis TaxID=299421 RepID=A0A8T4IU44_9ACTN|nr:hypothetical protein [Streptomyces daliensis]